MILAQFLSNKGGFKFDSFRIFLLIFSFLTSAVYPVEHIGVIFHEQSIFISKSWLQNSYPLLGFLLYLHGLYSISFK